MDLNKDKYIVLEIIPTRSSSDEGYIAQISALKLEGLKLLDRFDYRVKDELIENDELRRMLSYDKQSFTYVDNVYFIIEKFKRWVEDLPLLIIEDKYTLDYLKELENKKELIYPYINIEYSDDVFEKIIEKYQIEPTPHLVDILYEAIIFSRNNKED